MYRMNVWIVGLCLLPVVSEAAPSALVGKLLVEGSKLLQQRSREDKDTGADLLLRANRLAPDHFETLVAATRAFFVKSNLTSDKKKMASFAQQGWAKAEILIRRWPQRAEGYYWACVNIGKYAQGSGVWVAMTKGLAKKIEEMALAALKRDPSLYKGASQRALGRYFYMLPWPMRNLDRSLAYLEDAYRQDPSDLNGILFLADTLRALGRKDRAQRLYRTCAFKKDEHSVLQSTNTDCRRWLASK